MERETEQALDAIASALAAHPRINDWTVRSEVEGSTQLFLVGTEPEAVRQVSAVRYVVTAYCDHDRGRGQASIILTPADLRSLDASLERVAFMASLGGNPPYSLPEPAPLPEVQLLDEKIATRSQAEEAAALVREQVVSAMAAEERVRLSSLEAFLDTSRIALRTSRGVEGEYRASRVMLDLAIISSGDDDKESEAQETWVRRRLADLDLPALVREQAAYARDALMATLPEPGQYPVVLEAEAMQALFRPVLFRASGAARYSGESPWEIGHSVLAGAEHDNGASEGERSSDPVTIISDTTFPYGTTSRPFDDEGLPGQRVTLVENGVLRHFLANRRYADYLQIDATGPAGVLVLNTGESPASSLMDPGGEPLLHVISFSSMQPDAITGDFSAEIRLGYLVTSDGTRPVRGGTVSGNVFSALSNARLSREGTFLGSYHGPRLVRFNNLSITA